MSESIPQLSNAAMNQRAAQLQGKGILQQFAPKIDQRVTETKQQRPFLSSSAQKCEPTQQKQEGVITRLTAEVLRGHISWAGC